MKRYNAEELKLTVLQKRASIKSRHEKDQKEKNLTSEM